MDINVIKSYLKKLNKNKINAFFKNNNIYLKENELDFLYRYINNNDLFDNIDNTKSALKNNLSDDSYKKILELYNYYESLFLK